ncbi:translation initiation factor IF-3 [Acidiferrimicrobium sp. IK]|nr:translation initiation factor IF-3 [Acidiferrimicrobium sp. IK]
MNDRIRAREVRLIDSDGGQLGVKPLPEALSIARQLDLDLVEVAPDANPPVCRIMDYNRFKYEAAQRAKESRRKTTSTSIKEMKYRPKIGTGDFDTKTRQVARFLGEGHKVKITIMFRGREMSHPELGKKILDHVAETVGDVAKVEAAPKLDGRNMIMVLAPDRRQPPKPAKAGGEPPEGGQSPDGGQPPAGGPAPDAPASAGANPAPSAPAQPAGSDGSAGQSSTAAPAPPVAAASSNQPSPAPGGGPSA